MSKYPLYSVEYYTTFRQMLDRLKEKYGDSPAISWYTRNQQQKTVSYAGLHGDVAALRRRLEEMGLAGKHIAVVGENSYEWLTVYLAAACCGAVVVCVDVEQSDETILQMLKMADVSAIFFSTGYTDICETFEGAVQGRFLLSGKSAHYKTVAQLQEEGNNLPDDPHVTVSPEQTAAIVFTSGTTSCSKMVMLSQEAILTNASDALANVQVGKKTFTALPFYHTYGLTCSVLAMLIPGSHLFINGNIKTLMRDLQLARPHTLLTVPLMLETIHKQLWISAEETGKAEGLRKLLRMKKALFSLGFRNPGKTLLALREKILGEVQLIICGGAHLNPGISEQLHYMGVNVLQGYGITECAPLVSVNRNLANKWESVGLVTANCQVKILDGEILVRGKNVMQGYYNQPELTAAAMKDGWFCTGDLGMIDKNGFLYITGRKKNLIVLKNGKKVSPEKLEEKIRTIPLVQDVMVSGTVSGIGNDDVQITASIYPNKERAAGMTTYDILESIQADIDRINNDLPIYQQIQMIVLREQEFSKTALQKIKRHLS